MKSISITGRARTQIGGKQAKADRRSGGIPAVLYGGDETVHFTTTAKSVKNLVYTPDFKVVDLDLDGKSYRCILKDMQVHPVSEQILHMDFLQLVDGKKVKLEVPVRFRGSSPGVKLGGKLQQNLRRVKIKTTPEHMVDELYVDISSLELGEAVRVRDIDPVDNVEINNAPATPVATVEIPRALRSAAAAEKAEAK